MDGIANPYIDRLDHDRTEKRDLFRHRTKRFWKGTRDQSRT